MNNSTVDKIDGLFRMISDSSKRKINQILIQILNSLTSIENSEGCGIVLLDNNNIKLNIVAQILPNKNNVEILKKWTPNLYLERIIRTGKLINIKNDPFEFSTGYIIKSFLGHPIRFKGKIIGAVYVFNEKRNNIFTKDDEKILSFISNLTYIAVNRSMSFQENHYALELEILNKIARILNTVIDPSKVYYEVVHQIGTTLSCTHCTLYIPKKYGHEEILIPEATWSKKGKLKKSRKFKVNEGLLGRVYESQTSQLFSDAANNPSFLFGENKSEYHPRSMLIVPITSGGEVLGMICADQNKLNWFTENDLRLVNVLATHISAAIERSLALKATNEISVRLIGVLNPEHMNIILDIVLKTAVELTKATTGVVYLLADDQSTIIKNCSYPANSFHPLPRRDELGNLVGLTKKAIDLKDGFIIENVNEKVHPKLQNKIKSMAVYPLISRDKVIGVLFLDDENGHIYTPIEKLIIETLVNQAGIALTSYNLIDELEQSKQEYFDLFDESLKDRDGIASKMFYREISHNVKNVLAQVFTNMELIISSPNMRRVSRNQKDRLEELIDQVKESISNIEEFLNLVSEEAGQKKICKIQDIVNHASRLLSVKILNNNININLSKMNDSLSVNVHKTQMIMAFLNLIDNSIDALKNLNSSKEIKIYTQIQKNSPWIEIVFEDNGCGITNENHERLFQPFFSTKSAKGRGIGLLGTQRIIEMHHGRLPKPSSQLGKGTKFTVFLPKQTIN